MGSHQRGLRLRRTGLQVDVDGIHIPEVLALFLSQPLVSLFHDLISASYRTRKPQFPGKPIQALTT